MAQEQPKPFERLNYDELIKKIEKIDLTYENLVEIYNAVVKDAENLAELIKKTTNDCMKTIERFLEKLVYDMEGIHVKVEAEPYKTYEEYEGAYYSSEKKIVIYMRMYRGLPQLINILFHEVRHFMQHRVLGDKYDKEYFDAGAKFGYWKNPFQVDARKYSANITPLAIRHLFNRIGVENYGELHESIHCVVAYSSQVDSVVNELKSYLSENILEKFPEKVRTNADVKDHIEIAKVIFIENLEIIYDRLFKCCYKISYIIDNIFLK